MAANIRDVEHDRDLREERRVDKRLKAAQLESQATGRSIRVDIETLDPAIPAGHALADLHPGVVLPDVEGDGMSAPS